ncbi:hypothetical protein NKI96_11110 [Mesorhizobium sp. M0292]|uniref:hypothetical protein n=1 Tax=Mesorhizobium sp. M0292 TaxID=2956929 RepID=UPI003339A8EA
MSFASEIYAKRANRRSPITGSAPQAEKAKAPARARQDHTVTAPTQSVASTKPSTAMPEAAAIYARRQAQRAARPAGAGEVEE